MAKERYDQPIPFGWYAIEYSANIKPGDVKPLKYFDEDLVLFRTESGEAQVLDAYCPHLGAHLGHGGLVKGESISCPFHAWEFNGQGMATNIPYARRTPPKVKNKQCIKSYPVVEKNQMIWAWYHPYDAAPTFEVEDIPEIGHEDWSEVSTFDWVIPSIIQETGENAADIAHFVTVHGMPDMPDGEVTYDGIRRVTEFDGAAKKVSDDGTIARNNNSNNLEAIHLFSANTGPGQTMQRFSRLFDIVMMGTITPIDTQNIHLRFNFTLPKEATDIKKAIAEGIRNEIVRQVEQDIPIWEHKKYLPQPILCDGDGPIGQYRRWFKQFYAEKPVETSEKKEELIAAV